MKGLLVNWIYVLLCNVHGYSKEELIKCFYQGISSSDQSEKGNAHSLNHFYNTWSRKVHVKTILWRAFSSHSFLLYSSTCSSPEPVWMLSIAHRVTGMILTPTLSLLAITYVASGSTFTEYVTFLAPFYQSPFMWGLLKFSVVFPFAYHCFNGLRHLVCDLLVVNCLYFLFGLA